jgi:hypothetical protein
MGVVLEAITIVDSVKGEKRVTRNWGRAYSPTIPRLIIYVSEHHLSADKNN